LSEIALDRDHYLELEKLALGAFTPVAGFMNEDEFRSVANTMRLTSGEIFTIPILLDVSRDHAAALKGHARVALVFEGREVGEIRPDDFYSIDKAEWLPKLFGTTDRNHPGVAAFLNTGEVFVGGPIALLDQVRLDISKYEMTPSQTRSLFIKNGWSTVACFHTRNVPHRAHEFLQRLALDICDGLFIQPMLGRKKIGDFTPDAIMTGYRTLISGFYPEGRVSLGALSTACRYAGPREAVFHALVRRNFGGTHMVIGRDHAGVVDYYNKYDSQALCKSLESELGIKILAFHAPHHCTRCEGIVTEKTCPHLKTDPKAVSEVSGTMIRASLAAGKRPPAHIIRPEVLDSIKGLELFVDDAAGARKAVTS
jgi:sulfate adenylyltransferase